jgi:hypothetical protein
MGVGEVHLATDKPLDAPVLPEFKSVVAGDRMDWEVF